MPESGLRCPCGLAAEDCVCECGECVSLRQAAQADARHYCTRHNEGEGAWLAQSAFSRRASGTLQSWCRQCAAAHARSRRQTRPTDASVSRRTSRRDPFDRPFGLEIEVIHGDMYVCRDAFQAAGIPCVIEGYNHDTRDYWKLVTDGSVPRGYEVVSPVLRGAEGRRQARAAFAVLRSIGATVDRTCGLHVHHDVSDLTGADLQRLVEAWHAEQGSIDGLVAPSRRGGQGGSWCRPLDSRDLEAARILAQTMPGRMTRREAARILGHPRSELRYRSLNFRVFSLHGTVEVRQHQGTVNATKALSWVMFGQAYLSRCQGADVTHRASIRDVLSDLEAAGLEPATVAYLNDRAEAFAGGQVAA